MKGLPKKGVDYPKCTSVLKNANSIPVYEGKMMRRYSHSFTIQFIFYLSFVLNATGATSVSQFGVTWEFDTDYETGQFANGDYYVVENVEGAGVTITRMSPEWDGIRHGAEKNPNFGGSQGFDTRMKNNKFSDDLNIADNLPINVKVGTSILKSIGKTDLAIGDKPQLETIAILTILDAPPPPGSFRPFYHDVSKRIVYNESDLDYSILRSLKRSKVSNVPNLDTVSAKFERPWIEIHGSWVGRYTHPEKNMPTYGREMAYALGDGLLSLQLDYSNERKKETYIRLVQIGIDIYGAILNGGTWHADGGHNQGRKMPLILAALALGDKEMLKKGDKELFYKFQEDQQTFYITQTEVDMTNGSRWTPDKRGGTPIPYSTSDIGMPEWGFKHKNEPNRDNKLWSTYYRDVSGSATIAHVLTAHLMGVESIWNHPPLFDYYTNRYWPKEEKHRANTVNEIKLFYASMWDNYRYSNPNDDISVIQAPTISPQNGNYKQPQSVTISADYENVEIRYTTDGTEPNSNSPLYSAPLDISNSTTIAAIAINTTTKQISSITSSELNIEISGPQIEPSGGNFMTPTWAELINGDELSEIRYTLDGSKPTLLSPQYTGPIFLDKSSTIRAQSFSNGHPLADEAYEAFSIGEFASSEDWNNIDIPPLTGEFTITFEATPSAANIDSVTGLSTSPTNEYSNLACIVRFSSTGKIDVRDGSTYRSDIELTYQPEETYNISLSVNTHLKTYSVRVNGKQLSQNYSFRTEQLNSDSLSYIALKSIGSDYHEISDIILARGKWQLFPGTIEADSNWTNKALEKKEDSFKVSFELSPSADLIDAVTGLSNGPAQSYTDLACIVRLSPEGVIDVRDGSRYRADSVLQYQNGTIYRVDLDVNLPSKTYNVTVNGTVIAENYQFRTEQVSIDQFNNLATYVAPGASHKVSNISVYNNALASPTAPLELNIVSKN